ncbi:hypothetical protein [Enterovirga sp. CN4-39]|uniref:hypothetical protein n=1 Tax=Enterovirga sp. CN4-39 TaxID=3400910 RepID=UPI003BFDD987
MRRYIAFAVWILVGSAFAQECSGIINHGMRNIVIKKTSAAATVLKYYNNCGKNFSSMSDDQLASIEIEVIGYGSGTGGFTRAVREQKLNEWCTTNKDTATQNAASYEEAQSIFSDAVQAWNRCNELLAADISINPIISQDNRSVTMSIRYKGPTSTGVKFYGIAPEGFSCSIKGPANTDYSGLIPGGVAIGPEALSVVCSRDSPKEVLVGNSKMLMLERAVLSVQTASYPFQLFFPREYDEPLPQSEARAALNQIVELKSRLDKIEPVSAQHGTLISGLQDASQAVASQVAAQKIVISNEVIKYNQLTPHGACGFLPKQLGPPLAGAYAPGCNDAAWAYCSAKFGVPSAGYVTGANVDTGDMRVICIKG